MRKTDYLTTAEVAAMHGLTRARVGQLAEARGVVPWRPVGRSCLWTPAQAKALAPRGFAWSKGLTLGPRKRCGQTVEKESSGVAQAGGLDSR